MKYIIFTSTLIFTSIIPAKAMAACSTGGGWTQVSSLSTALSGKTACSASGQGTQEEHHSNSDLYDYKCGTTEGSTGPGTACEHPDTDRRKKLGTWSTSGDGLTVSYSYTAFGSATSGPFTVFVNRGTYDFCSDSTSVGIFTLADTIPGSRVCS